MQVSRSGYYSYIKELAKPDDPREEKILIEVKALSNRVRNSYGSRRISKQLKQKGYAIGRYAARTLMSKAGISCKQRRRYQVTTQSKHNQPIAGNLLNRGFRVEDPNCVWVADITYVWTCEGGLYIAAVLDLFSRRVIGWAIDNHMKESLINNALEMALGRRQPKPGLMHHSDRGSQYASHDYQSLLAKAGMIVSMSRKGNCWDNAVMERFFGSLKSECTEGANYLTREAAKADIIDYIEMFYNSERLHSTLGYVSPLHFEQNINHFS
jgi:putative transposase